MWCERRVCSQRCVCVCVCVCTRDVKENTPVCTPSFGLPACKSRFDERERGVCVCVCVCAGGAGQTEGPRVGGGPRSAGAGGAREQRHAAADDCTGGRGGIARTLITLTHNNPFMITRPLVQCGFGSFTCSQQGTWGPCLRPSELYAAARQRLERLGMSPSSPRVGRVYRRCDIDIACGTPPSPLHTPPMVVSSKSSPIVCEDGDMLHLSRSVR